MPTPPTGIVTLLFTDIEGSTRLIQHLGDRFPAILAAHHQLLRAAFRAWQGHEVRTEGDSFFLTFARAGDAVNAAAAAQRAIAEHPWPDGVALRVRMGLHTGEPIPLGNDYTGLDVHRAARIAASGHGGQVLLSQATAALVEADLSAGLALRDLGVHRLKDLLQPEHIFQLAIASLPETFPPLKTLNARATNLPAQATALIGRKQELAALRNLLRRGDVRLVTLTGAGGTGKTRLAQQVAADLLDPFGDGVFFVDLAPIADPDLVSSTIAQALEVREAGSAPIAEQLKAHLRDKHLLLVLDNFEQILPAAPLVAELLATAPRLKVLATSRASLRLYGEHEIAVVPLAVPDSKQLPALKDLAQYDAIRLFVERVQAVKPDFTITGANAQAVAEICVRLDGLPLALELVAARAKLFAPQSLLARLGNRLQLLTGGPRDLPARQQTIRSTIDWSYNLLNADEQALFRALAVFVGGFTLAAAEAVASELRVENEELRSASHVDDGLHLQFSIFNLVEALVDKSLLRQEHGPDGEPRFTMLETIREYALELLTAHHEAAALSQRHALYYLRFAEAVEPALVGAQQDIWVNHLDREHPNLRAALQWSLAHADAETSLRFGSALWQFWAWRGYLHEGRAQLAAGLKLIRANPSAQVPATTLAKALHGAGRLASDQDDLTSARALLKESLALFRELGDMYGRAVTLDVLGWVTRDGGDHGAAETLWQESLTCWRALGDPAGLASVLNNLGYAALARGDTQAAQALHEESLALRRTTGAQNAIAWALYALADIAQAQGNTARAIALYTESLALFRQLGDPRGGAWALYNLGSFAQAQGRIAEATEMYVESLQLFRDQGAKKGSARVLHHLGYIAMHRGDDRLARAIFEASLALAQQAGLSKIRALVLPGLAALLSKAGEPALAARLAGAAAAQLQGSAMHLAPLDRANYEASVALVRAQADPQALAASWAEGQTLTLEQAADEALASTARAVAGKHRLSDHSTPLDWLADQANALDQIIVGARELGRASD